MISAMYLIILPTSRTLYTFNIMMNTTGRRKRANARRREGVPTRDRVRSAKSDYVLASASTVKTDIVENSVKNR